MANGQSLIITTEKITLLPSVFANPFYGKRALQIQKQGKKQLAKMQLTSPMKCQI